MKLLLLILIFGSFAHADTFLAKDDIAPEIRALAKEGYDSLRGLAPEMNQFVDVVEAQLPNVRAYVTNENLVTSTSGPDQDSVAMNFPKYGLLLFNSARWAAITNHKLRVAIAIHEVGSLIGIEKTGVYTESAPYIAMSGLRLSALSDPLRDTSTSPDGHDGYEMAGCQWLDDRVSFYFEVWETSVRECKPVTGLVAGMSRFKENALRDAIVSLQKHCIDPKKLANAQNILQMIPPLKKQFGDACAN